MLVQGNKVAGSKFNSSKAEYDSEGNVIKNWDSIEGMPGKTKVCIYWMLPDGTNYESVSTVKNDLKNIDDRKGIRLFVEVTCESASQSYTVSKEYKLNIENYNMGKSEDKVRFSHLKKDGVVNEPSVNPLGLKMSDGSDGIPDDLYYGEKWVWVPTEE